MSTQSTDSIISPVVAAVPPADVIPPDVYEAAVKLGVAQYLPRVIDVTREIYGPFSRVWVQEDPEIPDNTHIIFDVPVDCSVEEALDKDDEWGRRLLKIIPRSPQVYLVFTDFRS